MRDLHGRTVLLTGASSGIGPYIARRLAREGARLILSARNEKALKALAKELGEARVIPADLSRRGEPERLAEEAAAVVTVSREDGAEIVVAPLSARFGAAVGGARPELAISVARAAGAARLSSEAGEKQSHKR